MQTGKKGLALLLALLMVFSLLPVSALAADGCLTTTDAGKTFAAKQGENLTVQLAQYFTDSEGHTLTYTLDAYGDEIFSGTVTKIYSIGTEKQNATYFDVRVTLPTGKTLLPGMNGTVTLGK